MVEDGLNISSGINQGAAQILHPFQNPITPQLELAVVQQEQAKKAAADKKRAELYGSLKDFNFKGLANHAPAFVNRYNQIIDEAAIDLKNGDPLAQIKAQQKMGNLNTQMQLSADLKNEIGDVYGNISKNSSKQFFPNAEENLKYAMSDLSPQEMGDIGLFGKGVADRLNKLHSITPVERFDELKTKKDALTLFNMQASERANQGKEFYGLGDAKNDVRDFILGTPENMGAQYYYENLLKNDPSLQKQYGKDWQGLAIDRLAEEVNKIPKPSSGGNTYNNYPANPNPTVTEQTVTEQVLPIGIGAQGKQGRPVQARVFTYSDPVNLGSTIAPEGMFKINPTTGQSEIITKQQTPEISYNQTVELPVLTEDVHYKEIDPTTKKPVEKIAKKGTVVDDKSDIKEWEKLTGKKVGVERKLFSVGFDKDATKYYTPAQYVAPSTVAHFYGAKGGTAKSQYNKEGIENTATPKDKKPAKVGGLTGKSR